MLSQNLFKLPLSGKTARHPRIVLSYLHLYNYITGKDPLRKTDNREEYEGQDCRCLQQTWHIMMMVISFFILHNIWQDNSGVTYFCIIFSLNGNSSHFTYFFFTVSQPFYLTHILILSNVGELHDSSFTWSCRFISSLSIQASLSLLFQFSNNPMCPVARNYFRKIERFVFILQYPLQTFGRRKNVVSFVSW